MLWAHGTSKSKGVAILFPVNFHHDILDIKRGGEGRTISCKVKTSDGLYFNVLNIYAPNVAGDRKRFFSNDIRMNGEENNIVLGDFNCTLNKDLDRKYVPNNDDVGTKELQKILRDNYLIDIWRARYPSEKQYTFSRGNSKSRIDFILISSAYD